MLAAYVLDSQGGHDIDRLSLKYLGTDIPSGASKAVFAKKLADVILPKLKEKGYSFEKVSELIYKDNYKIDHSGKQIKLN